MARVVTFAEGLIVIVIATFIVLTLVNLKTVNTGRPYDQYHESRGICSELYTKAQDSHDSLVVDLYRPNNYVISCYQIPPLTNNRS